ncbi:DUF1266 domain-containing protein [Paenibacillus sp. IHBB 3054]|uniref:DUF1266 domain-containing protein n=1 Tax=Paenibacillus sp. IHBB 3054 TaxID=3425689 RepID=UPI003F66C35F
MSNETLHDVTSATRTWIQALGIISETIDRTPFTTWFKDTTAAYNDETFVIEKLIVATADYFEEDSASLLQEIASLFHHNKDWLAYTKGLSWSAFNYSRAISIIAGAAVSDIITEQEASELCDYYGSAAESMFGDWQTFLFSAILGKQLLTPNEDRFILGANDYIGFEMGTKRITKYTITGNGVTILEIGPNLNRLGLSKAKTLTLSKKETLELYKPDLDNLTKAIQELKQQLSV